MKPRSPLTYVRGAIVAAGVLLPTLTLIPLGSVWLWQHGYLLWWVLGAGLFTTAAFLLQLWLFRDIKIKPAPQIPEKDRTEGADPSWTPGEMEAWAEVQRRSREVSPDALSSRDAAMKLALDTIEAVALRIHPQVKDPLWQFTVPEAFALSERVSLRLRTFVEENVPLGDRLTVGQAMRLYRWRGAIDIAERAYDVWRAVRLLNPIAAATNELREQLSKKMLEWSRDHLAKRLAQVYIEEVGRAAIDLYSGRLRVSKERLASHVTRTSAADAGGAPAPAEPIRILVAGQVSVGKSSLINALAKQVRAAVDALPSTNKFTAYQLEREGFPAALFIDSPGIGMASLDHAAVIAAASECDLVLWVSAAHRADREADRAALGALRKHFEDRPNRRRPPAVLVLTHIDRLRPFQDWNPPYDLTAGTSGKAASIRTAVEASAHELGFAEADVVPVSLAEQFPHYNVDAVWAKIVETLPDVQRAHLVRCLRDAEGVWDWSRIWSQAMSGGRVLARTVIR